MNLLRMLDDHGESVLYLAGGLIVLGILLTVIPGFWLLSSVLDAVGFVLFSMGVLVHGIVRRAPVLFAISAVALIGAALVLIPGESRPRGSLILVAVVLAVLVLMGRRSFSSGA